MIVCDKSKALQDEEEFVAENEHTFCCLALTVLVTAIDALQHFETG